MAEDTPRTLILDVGKTHTKACVVDHDGRTRARMTHDTPFVAAGEYPHVDLDTLGAWLIDALAALGREFPIRTIVPVAHGACVALLAGDALAVPIMDYEWPGVAEIDAAYDRMRPPFSETRSPALVNGLNIGRQLYWLASRRSASFERADTLLFYPQFWAWFLSGARVCEVTSPGAHSDLWDPAGRTFSSLVARAGWDSLMPPVRRAWETAGTLRPDVARRTGLAEDCIVKTGVHDSNASYLRHLAGNEKPFTVVSTGTWIIMMAAGADLQRLDESRDMLANVDVYGDPVPSARFMGGREFAGIAGEHGLEATPDGDDLSRLIARGTMALPSFVNAGGPFSGCRGRVIGPAPGTARERAGLATLYCALVCDYALSLLGVDGGALIVEGSFAANTLFCRLLGQLREQPVRVSDDDTGTVSGAALLTDDRGPIIRPAATRPVDPAALDALDAYRRAWRQRCDTRQ